MYIPEGGYIRSIILEEAHRALYFAHLGVKKMYADMKKLLFWVGMKRDVVHFIVKCLECQQVNVLGVVQVNVHRHVWKEFRDVSP
jgi:hypothetical protein